MQRCLQQQSQKSQGQKDAHNLLTCRLQRCLPHKSKFITWDGSVCQTCNYKCDVLKWQNYSVGGESKWASFNAEGLLPRCILLRAVLFLPYALCIFKTRWEPELLQEPRTFLSICCSVCATKNKNTYFSRQQALFSAGHRDRLQMFKVYGEILKIW